MVEELGGGGGGGARGPRGWGGEGLRGCGGGFRIGGVAIGLKELQQTAANRASSFAAKKNRKINDRGIPVTCSCNDRGFFAAKVNEVKSGHRQKL